jgi:hypothetical protein
MMRQETQLKPLEEKDIQRILALMKSGKSSESIAEELGVAHWGVLLILTLYK